MVTVRNKQSQLDLAMQLAGTPEAVFELAVANGISITGELKPGGKLLGASLPNEDRAVLEDYARKNVKPATKEEKRELDGIGYWAVEDDFIVS